MVVTLREPAKKFADLISTDATLQAIAVEYGFRTNAADALVEASAKAGLSIKPRVVDVIDPPSYETMAEMIDVITQQMKN